MVKIFITLITLLLSINADENVGFLTNQKYVCASTQLVVGNQVINHQTEKEALTYPQRFYVDDKNILHTDGKIDNTFTHKKDTAYESKDSVIVLEIKDNTRYMYRAILTGELKGTIFIFKCLETDNWTVGR
jgi:hypothetical protein